jgi:hypothetical protein
MSSILGKVDTSSRELTPDYTYDGLLGEVDLSSKELTPE